MTSEVIRGFWGQNIFLAKIAAFPREILASEKRLRDFFFAFDTLQGLLLVNLAYKSVGNFKKNPNIVQSSSIAVPDLAKLTYGGNVVPD